MKVLTNKQYKQEKIHGHYFLDFSIENVRCYGKRQTLKLADANGKPCHWTIILGDNGVGKTSLLKGLVSMAPSPKNIYGDRQKIKLYPGLYDWRDDWNTARFDGKQKSVLEAGTVAAYSFSKLLPREKLLLHLEQGHSSYNDIQHNEEEYGRIGDFLCFAYGASRKMGRNSFTSEKYSTASVSLFNDEAPLINVEEFFMQADYEAKTSRSTLSAAQRNKIKQLLIDILPEVTDLRITKSKNLGRYVEIKTPFGWVRISEMSLGYKSLIAWVVDFASRMYHYHRTKANPFAEPAVVLIDEIDLHLHPKWQRKVLGYLSKKFPNTQFIATAHSPLIVQAAENANLVLLKRVGTQVIIENDPDMIKNWRIDQILTSDLFGLSSARSEQTEKKMTERRKLLEKPRLTANEKKKLGSIEESMDYIPVAETPEYIEAMKLIYDTSKRMAK
jgi:energy-coupling factor transporter ATP-binding protein EcfA2